VVASVILALSVVAASLVVGRLEDVRRVLGGTVAGWHAGQPAGPLPPVLSAPPASAPLPTPDGLTRTAGPLLSAPALGGQVAVSVVDLETGRQLFTRGDGTALTPASVAKLLTGVAVLTARGPAYRLETRVVAGGQPGEVVLIGGGDPTLAAGQQGYYPDAAHLPDLAAQVKKALGGQAPTRVVVDASLYTGPRAEAHWDSDATTGGYSAAITALMTDGARTDVTRKDSRRYPAPEVAAGEAFARALGLPASAVVPGTAPAGAAALGVVRSPPMARLVELMLTESDNVIAECLARQIALARGQPASFDGGAAGTVAVLTELGLPAGDSGLLDGSGLSRADRLTARLLAAVLVLAARPDRPQLRAVLTGLPVAAYSGTLATRYQVAGASGAGTVRAKTGTLDGVSAIAGTVVDADGRELAFVLVGNGVGDTASAQQAQDRFAAALAGCGCR
jgi:D-alanyl-D-alanine carboxypeptidase/D-alanyl-D-alanine-endopeptidase (penicillin-binding protein 4)